jgi:hypothetical protein
MYCCHISLELCVISGFRRDADDICALLGYYATLSGSSVPTFRNNLSAPSSKGQEVQEGPKRPRRKLLDFFIVEAGTVRLSRNVGTELPLNVAYYPRRAQISCTSLRKHEITQAFGCYSAVNLVAMFCIICLIRKRTAITFRSIKICIWLWMMGLLYRVQLLFNYMLFEDSGLLRITTCRLVSSYRRFGCTYYCHRHAEAD